MTADKKTLGVYSARAAEYAAVTGELTGDRHLAVFIAAMPPGARVLDIGCGPGRAAGQMAAAGLRVDAMDAAPEMVAMTAAHPGVTAWQATFDEIAGEALYDGVWANFSLLHAPRAAFPAHLAAIRRALRPGGLFHLGMKTGEGEGRDALGRFYTYYTEDALRALLTAAGLSPGQSWSGRDTGLAGTLDDWSIIHAHA